VVDLIEKRLQDAKAVQRAKVQPVVNQVIEDVGEQLCACPEYQGTVREQLQPVIVSAIRFLARCLNAQEGGGRSHTQYLFDPEALEGDLQQDLVGWLDANGLYGFTIEAQHIGGGRIDLMFTFDGFRFVIELKREQGGATRSDLSGYLRQAGAYQVTDVALGMLVVLDTTSDPLAPHIRDNVWVDVLVAAEPGGTDRYLVVVRVPGNRKSPSRL
jgi:hypothetical protein